MTKEEEFAMIEELCEKSSLIFQVQNDVRFRISNQNSKPENSNTYWNKNEFKAFIDELLVLHSKMK